jgi:5-methylcytosine-specific restriction enzyme B
VVDAVGRGFGPAPEVEVAGRAIIDAGLRGDSSPLWTEPTWTVKNAEELLRRIFENYDEGPGSFVEKLENQLGGAEPGVVVLAAEFMALHLLPLSNVRGSTKRYRVEQVLSWTDAATTIPSEMETAFDSRGAFNGGTGFNVRQWQHFVWLAKFVQHACSQSVEVRDRAIQEPELFAQLTEGVDHEPKGIKYSVEYLAWPSYFEPITSRNHRWRIRERYLKDIGGLSSGDDDPAISQDLAVIRKAHDAAAGTAVDWYLEPYLSEWSGSGKRTGGQKAWLVRQNQSGTPMLPMWLEGGFVSVRAEHLESLEPGSSVSQVQRAVNSGYQHIDYAERKQRALEFHRFLTIMHPDDPVVTQSGDRLYLGVVVDEAEYSDDPTSRLRREVAWRRESIEARDLPAPLPRLLEEQGTIVDFTDGLTVIKEWLRETPDLLPDDPDEVTNENLPQPAVVPRLRAPDDELAASLHVKREDLQEVVELLQTRNQIVFYGPPGTGKTYLAGKIARYLAGKEHGDHVKTVQFHPSYAYEDFFEGYRPAQGEDGQVGFSLEPGPLRKIAAEASAEGNRDKPFFLIIDEMNRGNLAKVFGELYFLLEYRDQSINLQYSPTETFVLPPNLFIIGTMNTADRSIAMVDAAIRRRFAFVELHPQEGLIEGMLGRYLQAHDKEPLRAHLLDALNSELGAGDRDLMIGPSYFMKEHAASDTGLERIWRYELLPLLEEHYFGRMSRAEVHERFGLPTIRKKAARSLGAVDYIEEERTESGQAGSEETVGAQSQ